MWHRRKFAFYRSWRMGCTTDLTYCYPLYLSPFSFKTFFLTFFGIIAVASVGISQMPNNRIMERIDVARKDIQLYLDNKDGNTSLGARFEMWKSALEMVKEKTPIWLGHSRGNRKT